MDIQFGDPVARTAALREIASETYPNSDIQPLSGGESSSVVRAGDVVFKSPHSGVDSNSSIVRFEAAVADTLPSGARLATGAVLAVPQLIATHPDNNPPYNEFRFVPGQILPNQAIAQFSENAKVRLGKDLGSFVVWLSKTIPADTFEDIPSAAPTCRLTLLEVLQQLRLPDVETIRDRGYRSTADLLEELTSTPPPPYQDPELAPLIAVHGDLRPANITFENGRLKGVFDFGLLTLTDPAEELRATYFMGPATARAAIEQYYEETGLLIPLERIIYYAGAHAMHSATFCALNGTEKMGGFASYLRDFLDQHYPDKDWSELDRFQ